MAGQVLFNARELADLYALKTLYDYCKDDPDISSIFGGFTESDRAQEVLENAPVIEIESIDAVVECVSDISNNTYQRPSVLVDIALLKNAVRPMTEEQKKRLRKKYGLSSDKPVIVIGYADGSKPVQDIIEAFKNTAQLYLIGHASQEAFGGKQMPSSVHLVNKHGVLKDYYAMADVAINAHNLSATDLSLHNFVEATEGGPLFMVPSLNTRQYGYRQLVDLGVIRECPDLEGIIDGVRNYVQTLDNKTHTERRSRHLNETRIKYLPVIAALIKKALGKKVDDTVADLIVTTKDGSTRITHPDSHWRNVAKSYLDESYWLDQKPQSFSNKILFYDNNLNPYGKLSYEIRNAKDSLSNNLELLSDHIGTNIFFKNKYSDSKKLPKIPTFYCGYGLTAAIKIKP